MTQVQQREEAKHKPHVVEIYIILLWKRAMTDVAKEYGLSYRGLASCPAPNFMSSF